MDSMTLLEKRNSDRKRGKGLGWGGGTTERKDPYIY